MYTLLTTGCVEENIEIVKYYTDSICCTSRPIVILERVRAVQFTFRGIMFKIVDV